MCFNHMIFSLELEFLGVYHRLKSILSIFFTPILAVMGVHTFVTLPYLTGCRNLLQYVAYMYLSDKYTVYLYLASIRYPIPYSFVL